MNLIADARATSRALWSERMLGVGSIEWNEARFAESMTALPGEALKIAELLHAGQSPRSILETSQVDSRTLESVLLFAARRGVVRSVASEDGMEMSMRIELPARLSDTKSELRIRAGGRSVAHAGAQAGAQDESPNESTAAFADESEASTPIATSFMQRASFREDATDLHNTEYGEKDSERTTTQVDHTLYGGAVLETSPSAFVLTPRGPVALLTPNTPSNLSRTNTTPSPAFLNQEDVISVPNSLPSIPITVGPFTSESIALANLSAAKNAGDPVVSVKPDSARTVPTRGRFRKNVVPAVIFTASVLVGAFVVRSVSESRSTSPAQISEAPLPTGVELRPSEGALQIVADTAQDEPAPAASVQIDGVASAHNENATLVLPVGTHTVTSRGVTKTVDVKPSRLTKVRLRSNP
jgi:hypothetical protein